MSSIDNKNTDLDKALRPTAWDEYIGQNRVKQNLSILISAAKERGHSPEHLLFYGPPGLGKTTISFLVAKELNSQIRITSGPAVDKVADLAAVLSNLQDGDVLFIDEIHRLNKNIEEVLYPAMESGTLDILIGKGPSARVVQIDLPKFTLIGATTQISKISAPLRSRFSGGVYRLEFYNEDELKQILLNSAKKLDVEIENEKVLEQIASRARKTPRIANYLLKRVRDMAQINKQPLSQNIAQKTFELLEIDELGLDPTDKKILEVIEFKFNGGPVGLKTLSAALSEAESTIEEVLEPFLLQEGLMERTSRGRIITQKGKQAIGK